MTVAVLPVTPENWRDVIAVDAASPHVAAPAYYLCLCHYGGVWSPVALAEDGQVVGLAMWGHDAEDGHHWLGGISLDHASQGRGLGRQAVQALVEHVRGLGATAVALSYAPDNRRAARLYASLGFTEDGAADGETVARLRL